MPEEPIHQIKVKIFLPFSGYVRILLGNGYHNIYICNEQIINEVCLSMFY